MTDPDKPEIDDLINFINGALAKPAPAKPDLGIPLPVVRSPNQYVRGNLIEEIQPKPRPMPRPPYRCICGDKFETAEALLAHRHPMLPSGRSSAYPYNPIKISRPETKS